MQITKVETISEPGGPKKNEDTFFCKEKRFGVFDGASSLDGYKDENGKTGAYLASHVLKEAFEESDASMSEIVMEANQKIATEMIKKGIDCSKKENRWSSTIAVVDFKNSSFDWVQVADSLILVIYKDNSYKLLIEDDYDHDRELMKLWKEYVDKKVEDIRSLLQEKIVSLRRMANVQYGFANGESEVKKFIRQGSEPLDDVAHVLIFTDGFLIPNPDPTGPDDFEMLVKLFLRGGLKAVYEHVRELEETDPNCWLYPRYKKSDDLTAIGVSFVE